MMGLLHAAGYFPDLQGWEREFPERAAEAFPELAREELCRQQKIVMRDVYGEIPPVDVFQDGGGGSGQDERMPQAAVPILERVLGAEERGCGIGNLGIAYSGK